MADQILILGASVRAAAQSARGAGLRPYAIDLFADADLREVCPVIQVPDFGNALVSAADTFPICPWMYTGGIENHPRIIDSISRHRPLWGNPSEVTQRVRAPKQLSNALRQRGLLVPDQANVESQVPAGEWLVKPNRSAGGLSIQRFHVTAHKNLSEPSKARNFYLQRFVPGEAASAVYVGSEDHVRLLGITKQLIGIEGIPRKQFVYRGSIGPMPVSAPQSNQFMEIGKCLATDFGLRGLFGVDVIVDGDRVWTIEVNPRYTASIEVLERAIGFNAIQLHASSFRPPTIDPRSFVAVRSAKVAFCGKEIVYAKHAISFDARFQNLVDQLSSEAPSQRVADIPPLGTSIASGHPICTVFADGESVSDVEAKLNQLAETFSGL